MTGREQKIEVEKVSKTPQLITWWKTNFDVAHLITNILMTELIYRYTIKGDSPLQWRVILYCFIQFSVKKKIAGNQSYFFKKNST